VSTAAWEAVFMLVILKIPIVYLCAVVWWAVRAEPRPLEGAARLAVLDPDGPSWSERQRARPRGRRRGPHGSPVRRYATRPALASARARR
jgi:hypothetical protein